jgi:hypothetical protein
MFMERFDKIGVELPIGPEPASISVYRALTIAAAMHSSSS